VAYSVIISKDDYLDIRGLHKSFPY